MSCLTTTSLSLEREENELKFSVSYLRLNGIILRLIDWVVTKTRDGTGLLLKPGTGRDGTGRDGY